MRNLAFLFILCALVMAVGCKKEGQEGQVEPVGARFEPPPDRRITSDQATRYIEAAKLSQLAIFEYQDKRKAFEEKFEISPDQTELQDSLYLSEHPEVRQEHVDLQKWFQGEMDSVYTKAKISDEEFTWVGGALGDTVNREIQKRVETELNDFMKELEEKRSS
jgi:hypothetical protein